MDELAGLKPYFPHIRLENDCLSSERSRAFRSALPPAFSRPPKWQRLRVKTSTYKALLPSYKQQRKSPQKLQNIFLQPELFEFQGNAINVKTFSARRIGL
ncbi:hypothetical protein HER21_00070 [Pseudomonas sp. BGM005]|nr:hypothetical protein [Pseudomonas sp. BG5]